MAETRFTKGPWKAFEVKEGHFEIQTPAFPERCELVVLDKSRDGHEGYRTIETPANAHLIAAAPQMYEALTEVEWSDMGHCPQCGIAKKDSTRHLPNCILGNALAAALAIRMAKVTKSHIILENSSNKYRKSNGIMVGDKWVSGSISPYDEQVYREALREREEKNMRAFIRDYNWHNADADIVRSVYKMIAEPQKGNMTTLSFKDAAILSYLSQNPQLSKERKNRMRSGLSKKAAPIAKSLEVSSRSAVKRASAK